MKITNPDKLLQIITDQESIIEAQASVIKELSFELALLTAGESEETI